jgi:peptidoglycan L-alanyl-D-glutamate endopeptidase CwlK
MHLQNLFNEVVKHWDCTILEGHRSIADQQEAFRRGASKIDGVNQIGKHNHQPSLAADVAPYPVDWKDLERFRAFGGFVLGVASQLGIGIRWGGDWDGDREFRDQSFIDLPHFELVARE